MKRNQVRRNGSPAAAAPQSKTAHTKAGDSPICDGPGIALFKERDGGVADEIIDLSKAEHAALKRASRDSKGILMFMAEAALEKAATPSQSKTHGAAGTIAAQQSQTGQSNALGKTGQLAGFVGDPAELVPPSAEEVGVVIYDYDRDKNVGEFNLTAAEFARIRDAIAKTVDRPVDREAVTNFVRESLVHPSALTSGEIHIAVQVLVDLAVRKVQDCPIDEQICVWNALSKTLPDSAAREHARNIALLQSKVAARHLQFADTLSSQAAQPSPQRRVAFALPLLNLEETEAKLGALTRYIEADGCHSLVCYCDHVMQAQEQLVKE